MGEWLIVKARNATGERRIPPDKWFINQYTPLGDDADIYERKPFWGSGLYLETRFSGENWLTVLRGAATASCTERGIRLAINAPARTRTVTEEGR